MSPNSSVSESSRAEVWGRKKEYQWFSSLNKLPVRLYATEKQQDICQLLSNAAGYPGPAASGHMQSKDWKGGHSGPCAFVCFVSIQSWHSSALINDHFPFSTSTWAFHRRSSYINMNRSIQFIIYEDVEEEEIDPVEPPNWCLLLFLSSFLPPRFGHF